MAVASPVPARAVRVTRGVAAALAVALLAASAACSGGSGDAAALATSTSGPPSASVSPSVSPSEPVGAFLPSSCPVSSMLVSVLVAGRVMPLLARATVRRSKRASIRRAPGVRSSGEFVFDTVSVDATPRPGSGEGCEDRLDERPLGGGALEAA